MKGTLVITAEAGRRLRDRPMDVAFDDVLGCVGSFAAGDAIYLVVRGNDGGQTALATGISRIASQQLPPEGRHTSDCAGSAVVVAAADLHLLWPQSTSRASPSCQ